MKKMVMVLGMMVAVGLATPVTADDHKKNIQYPLAEIYYTTGCTYQQIGDFGTSLQVGWGWEEGTTQTKFGGDAVFMVTASIDEGTTFMEFEVEFGLTQYEPGTPADMYPGELVYRCSNDQAMEVGTCNGVVLGLRSAIRNGAAEYLGVYPEEITNLSAYLDGVYVKAMNPGKRNGRQNYMLTDICTESMEL